MGDEWLDEVENEVSKDLGTLSQACQRLRDLHNRMLECEMEYEEAKKAFTDYSQRELPDLFNSAGLEEFKLADGTKMKVVSKTSCKQQTTAPYEEKLKMCKWLEEHGVGDIVKMTCEVPQEFISRLDEAGITYKKDVKVNSTSLKSRIEGLLGYKGGMPQIQESDIPKAINFYAWQQVEVTK